MFLAELDDIASKFYIVFFSPSEKNLILGKGFGDFQMKWHPEWECKYNLRSEKKHLHNKLMISTHGM